MTGAGTGIPYRDCPYFGLDYYDEEYSAWFFGREADTDRIISNLRSARLTLLHADSGVGKSSLLRAGVASRLREFALTAASRGRRVRYVPVVFKDWKDDPLPELVACIRAAAAPFLSAGETLELSRSSLASAIRTASEATGASLLLMLDQFEEYFLYCDKEPTPKRLASELAACISDPTVPANFLIAIREDAYAGVGDMFKGRIPNVYGNYLDVDYLTRDAAADAIQRPVLDVYNHQDGIKPVAIEPKLVTAVLNQVPATAGEGATGASSNGDGRIATPLLQLVMETVWNEEQKSWIEQPANGRHLLRLETLNRLEGVERIVDTHLAKALDNLSAQRRQVAVDVFNYLVTPSGSKIAESIPDLAQRTGHPEEEVAEVLKQLDHERILRPVPPPPGQDQRFRRYEIFHDVLSGAINRVIASSQESRLEAEREAATAQASIERERARKFRTVAAAALALGVVALAIGAVAFVLWRTAVADKNAAESRRLAAASEANVTQDPELATLLALRAVQAGNTSEASTALRDALPRLQVEATLKPAPPTRSAAFSADGSELLTASADGRIRIWDAGDHHQIAQFGGISGLNGAALSPNNARVAAVYDDGTARIWNVAQHRVERVLLSPGSAALASVAFAPRGNMIATGGSDGKVRLWNVASGRLLRQDSVPSGNATVFDSVTFSRNGKELLGAAGSKQAVIWNLRGQVVHSFAGPTGLIGGDLSPNGGEAIAAAGDGTATIWNVHTGNRVRVIPAAPSVGLTYNLWAVAFSPNGKQEATGGGDGVVRLYRGTGKPLQLPTTPRTTITHLSYSPDGHQVLAAGADGTTIVWDATTGRRVAVLRPPAESNTLRAAAFSPDGRYAVLSSRFGTLSVYSCGRGCGERRAPWTRVDTIDMPENDWINSLAVDPVPDGYFVSPTHGPRVLIVGASEAGRLWLWDMNTAAPFGEIDNAGNSALNSVAIDPHNPYQLVAAGDDGSARVFNIATQSPVATLTPKGSVTWPIGSVTYSPRGDQIVTGNSDGKAQFWSAKTHREIAALSVTNSINDISFGEKVGQVLFAEDGGYTEIYNAHTRQYYTSLTEPGFGFTNSKAAAFSPDGTLIVTASSNSLAHLWDSTSYSQLLTLGGHDGPIETAAFSADGARAITASADGSAKIWDTAPVEQRELLPGSATLVTTAFDPKRPDIVATAAAGTGRTAPVVLWSRSGHRKLATLVNPYGVGNSSAEFSPDGRLLVTSGGSQQAKVWSMDRLKKPMSTLDADAPGSACSDSRVYGKRQAGINSASFSRDDQLIVTADNDGSACVWRREGTTYRAVKLIIEPPGAGAGLATSGASAPVLWAVFSPRDDHLLLTASSDGTAQIWNWASYQRVQEFIEPTGEAINTAWFSPNARLVVTGSDDGTAGIWNVRTGAELRQLIMPDHSLVSNANFNPSGTLIVTCGGAAHIYDAATGERLTDFTYGSAISDCQFSPNGKFVATVGGSGPTRIFSTELATTDMNRLKAIAQSRVTRQLTGAEKQRYGIS